MSKLIVVAVILLVVAVGNGFSLSFLPDWASSTIGYSVLIPCLVLSFKGWKTITVGRVHREWKRIVESSQESFRYAIRDFVVGVALVSAGGFVGFVTLDYSSYPQRFPVVLLEGGVVLQWLLATFWGMGIGFVLATAAGAAVTKKITAYVTTPW